MRGRRRPQCHHALGQAACYPGVACLRISRAGRRRRCRRVARPSSDLRDRDQSAPTTRRRRAALPATSSTIPSATLAPKAIRQIPSQEQRRPTTPSATRPGSVREEEELPRPPDRRASRPGSGASPSQHGPAGRDPGAGPALDPAHHGAGHHGGAVEHLHGPVVLACGLRPAGRTSMNHVPGPASPGHRRARARPRTPPRSSRCASSISSTQLGVVGRQERPDQRSRTR